MFLNLFQSEKVIFQTHLKIQKCYETKFFVKKNTATEKDHEFKENKLPCRYEFIIINMPSVSYDLLVVTI